MASPLLVTTTIGLLHGLIITKARVPSFVVTLAGLLAWSGVVLILTTQATDAGTVRIQDSFINGIANNFLTDLWAGSWACWSSAGTPPLQFSKLASRRREGLPTKPTIIVGLQVAGLALVVTGAVWYANKDRGVPMVALLLVVLLVFWSFVANRTRFGRHVYAVGGNPEAARRAGINVDRVRVAVFMIAGIHGGRRRHRAGIPAAVRSTPTPAAATCC